MSYRVRVSSLLISINGAPHQAKDTLLGKTAPRAGLANAASARQVEDVSSFKTGKAWRALWVLAAVSSLTACSRDTVTTSASDVTALDWQGTYQGPYHLFLTIETHGTKANGNWRAVGNREGEFNGTIKGDRLDIDWREAAGNGAAWTGRGYFIYHAANGNHPPQIFGERGMGTNETGDAWWAFKRRNRVSSTGLLDNTRGPDASDDDRDCPGCDEIEWER